MYDTSIYFQKNPLMESMGETLKMSQMVKGIRDKKKAQQIFKDSLYRPEPVHRKDENGELMYNSNGEPILDEQPLKLDDNMFLSEIGKLDPQLAFEYESKMIQQDQSNEKLEEFRRMKAKRDKIQKAVSDSIRTKEIPNPQGTMMMRPASKGQLGAPTGSGGMKFEPIKMVTPTKTVHYLDKTVLEPKLADIDFETYQDYKSKESKMRLAEQGQEIRNLLNIAGIREAQSKGFLQSEKFDFQKDKTAAEMQKERDKFLAERMTKGYRPIYGESVNKFGLKNITGWEYDQSLIPDKMSKAEAQKERRKELFNAKKEGMKPIYGKGVDKYGLRPIVDWTTKPRSSGKNKKYTEGQYKAAGFAVRAEQANAGLQSLIEDGYDPTDTMSGLGDQYIPDWMEAVKSDNLKSYQQVKNNFISAVLRKESGAAISVDEFKKEEKKYFPLVGDSYNTLRLKEQARKQAIQNLRAEAAGAYDLAKSGGGYKPSEGRKSGRTNKPAWAK